MKRRFTISAVVLSMIILLTFHISRAASPSATTTSATQPQPGGVWKVMIRTNSNVFGYPPLMRGAARDYAAPFFDRLLSVGNDGRYKPGLALSWDTSTEGKIITFKLRKGVTFHDGTAFNAEALKSNIDNLIPPKATMLSGITSVDVIDDYTVKLNLSEYNNLILYHFAANPATYMYSPEALKKNGADWATTHPVGTGPFMLKDYQPNVSMTLVKNPNYWQKGLPYLDGIQISQVTDPMTQLLTIKAGQAQAIYGVQSAATQLRADGYPLLMAPGSIFMMNFDIKNSPIFSKRQVREAIEYAIDKEAICEGPGEGLYRPVYQIIPGDSPDYNPALPPRRYDPAKAKKLLAEAGYPNGFSFKIFCQDTSWKDYLVAMQSYLDKVGIKMEINYVKSAQYNVIRNGRKIENGDAVFGSTITSSNPLFAFDSQWRSKTLTFKYVVLPAGIDESIEEAKSSRDPATITKINRQILKLLYDDETVVPLYLSLRIAALDKSVQDTGWYIYGDDANNEFGTRTWLKK